MRLILSILIPTIPSRIESFAELSQEVISQVLDLKTIHPTLGDVEIVTDSQDSFMDGGPSIGAKRNFLVKRASGKYLCFLDDDENISPSYVESLVRLCHQDKDLVTFRAFVKTDFYWGLCDMSLSNKYNEEATPERIFTRPPWHQCPVRSRIAKLFSFPDTNYSEDWAWMEKVLTKCGSEAHTDQILLQYNHSKKTSEADKITKYVQSK